MIRRTATEGRIIENSRLYVYKHITRTIISLRFVAAGNDDNDQS